MERREGGQQDETTERDDQPDKHFMNVLYYLRFQLCIYTTCIRMADNIPEGPVQSALMYDVVLNRNPQTSEDVVNKPAKRPTTRPTKGNGLLRCPLLYFLLLLWFPGYRLHLHM